LQGEDVLRFDYARRTYAVYRTADGRFYATDGICTHGNTHLAGGFVSGTLVECPKHNGRFDIRDGSAQRLPVCVALKTYPLREVDGVLHIDVTSAGGKGILEQQTTYQLRVVSNRNVATFIKELVLELEPGSPRLEYRPGEYLQLDIPAYEQHLLRDIDVDPPYAGAWETQRVFDYLAANPLPCRRNYSFASNPAKEQVLRFNVRIAIPSPGSAFPAGVGSSYVFGLKPGDRLTAIGPFGDFLIKDTQREMVYLGGGAGMAPLRAHISYLLETQGSERRISYWYGGRSLQELFYQDYFAELERLHPNFSFHVALSEPQAADGWTGYTGFIHAVLKHAYLDGHPNPRSIEYYLCGPPAMVQAARAMLAELGVDPALVAFDEF
jgi:Na(+)-translocating NADH:ubiquinone oxidoreductase F subunit